MTDAPPLACIATKGWTSEVHHPCGSLLAGLVRLALVCFVLLVMLLLLRCLLLVVFGFLVCLGEGTFPTGLLGRVEFLLLLMLVMVWACLGALLGTLGHRLLLRQGGGTSLGEACTDLKMVFQLLIHGRHCPQP